MNHLANMPLDQLRALLKTCREEGVLSFATPTLSFTLGPKFGPVDVSDKSERPEALSAEDKLEQELFPE